MKGAEGQAVRAARFQRQDDRVTYSRVIIIARGPQRRLGYDVCVAGLPVRGLESGGLDIASTTALWKINVSEEARIGRMVYMLLQRGWIGVA